MALSVNLPIPTKGVAVQYGRIVTFGVDLARIPVARYSIGLYANQSVRLLPDGDTLDHRHGHAIGADAIALMRTPVLSVLESRGVDTSGWPEEIRAALQELTGYDVVATPLYAHARQTIAEFANASFV